MTMSSNRIMVVARPLAPAALVSDTFDRADSATSMGTADTGQTWTALAGTWGIETNRAYTVAVANSPVDRQVAVESGAADVTVAVDLAVLDTSTGGGGLLFRGVDASNYWIFTAEPAGGRWALYKRVAGTHTLVGSAAEAPTAARLSVVMSGSTITCKVDGVTKITATDTTHQAATLHGLRNYDATTTRYDNFKVEAA